MFGIDPYTPIDQLLRNVQEDWDDEYVAKQAASLEKAHTIVKKRIIAMQGTRKARHDKQFISSPISVGQRVLLKNCAFTTRHKLEDIYDREPYVVEWVNKEKDVYCIRPSMGGPTKTVNRKLLIEDIRDEASSVQEIPGTSLEPTVEETEDLEQESLIFQIPYWMFKQDAIPDESPVPQLRRSKRHNKGHHSNPAHLPRSTLSK